MVAAKPWSSRNGSERSRERGGKKEEGKVEKGVLWQVMCAPSAPNAKANPDFKIPFIYCI